jgi:hypothetical protein
MRDGIELFEIPKERLGIPLEILQQANSVNVLSIYLGLGYLLNHRTIEIVRSPQLELDLGQDTSSCRGKSKKEKVDYDELLRQDPRIVIAALNNYGFGNYTSIRWYQHRGFSEFGRGFAERVGRLPAHLKDDFMNSLAEAQKTHYAKPPLVSRVELVINLLSEVYSARFDLDFIWKSEQFQMRRLKTKSTTHGREGRLYITRERRYRTGDVEYSCTCPTREEHKQGPGCKHIKEMRASYTPN